MLAKWTTSAMKDQDRFIHRDYCSMFPGCLMVIRSPNQCPGRSERPGHLRARLPVRDGDWYHQSLIRFLDDQL